MSVDLHRLFRGNPLQEEAVRAWRKFFRVAGGPGRGVSYLVIGIIVLIYLWLLAEVIVTGRDLTDTILFFQLIVVTLVMPVSVYGAISGERERTTWEALILTRLTPAQIVAGKILWRVVTLLIIMFLFFVPLLLAQLVSEWKWTGYYAGRYHPISLLLLEELLTFTWGLGLCAYGLWISANTRRSVTSIALIFASMLAVLALVPAFLSMIGGDPTSPDNYLGWLLMHINAFFALEKLIDWQNRWSYGGSEAFGFNYGEWGLLPATLFAVGALVFLYATYRSLRIYEEPKHRLG